MSYSDFLSSEQFRELDTDTSVWTDKFITSDEFISALNEFFDSVYYVKPDQDNDDSDENEEETHEQSLAIETCHIREHDMNFHYLDTYPNHIVLLLLEKNFNERGICYESFLHIELVKWLYRHWKDAIAAPIVDKIKAHLVEVANMTSQEYNDILYNSENPRYDRKKHYMYYTWWLYVYYPLLDNWENLVMKLISLAYLEDAQDMLLYGLYFVDPERLAPFMKHFILTLHTQRQQSITSTRDRACFDIYQSGTGASGQISQILKKLKDVGYDLFNDHDLSCVNFNEFT